MKTQQTQRILVSILKFTPPPPNVSSRYQNTVEFNYLLNFKNIGGSDLSDE